jgi:hypothetical protein
MPSPNSASDINEHNKSINVSTARKNQHLLRLEHRDRETRRLNMLDYPHHEIYVSKYLLIYPP